MTDEEREPDEIVEKFDSGASIGVDITRGTGTRDQEKWKLKGNGETAEEAVEALKEELGEVFDLSEDVPLGTQVRNFQPEIVVEDGEEDDGEEDDE